MRNLLLIRHGATSWNQQGRYQGQTDVPLSEEGIRQGKLLATALAHKPLDRVYSSDLTRASQTAQFIADKHKIQVHLDKRLREFTFGVAEGLTRDSLRRKYPSNSLIPGAETKDQVRKRVSQCINEICHQPDQLTIIVSHGGTIRQALAYFYHPAKPRKELLIDNTGIISVEYEITHGQLCFLVKSVNNLDHLDG